MPFTRGDGAGQEPHDELRGLQARADGRDAVMGKKDFELVASGIYAVRELIGDDDADVVAHELANLFIGVYPRFDAARFLKATR